MAEEQYTWTDNPTESGKAICDTDILNECLMHLKYDNKGGSGLEVCDIGMALYVDETKGLRRYLNGQIVDINANTQAFLDRLKQITTLYPSLLCTEDEWQTAKTMSVFGQVGKFVFNYSGDEVVSVRIPRVVNLQGLFDLQNLGLTVAESLPNIKGIFNGVGTYNASASGAFKLSISAALPSGNGASRYADLTFDASSSSSTYKDGAHVQQEAVQYPYFIQIATGSETENNIINDIELNNPFSLFDSKYSDHELNNLSWLKSEGQWNAKAVYTDAYDKLLKVYNGTETVEGLSVKLSTEDYTDYDFVLNTAEETFRLPLKTKLASGKAVAGNGMTLGWTDGATTYGTATANPSNASSVARPTLNSLNKSLGTVLSSTTDSDIINSGRETVIGITTDPTKSGIETSDNGLYLYYYVGETVQNANLIDAGRIGEQLANKIGKDECSAYVTETYQNGSSWYRVWSDGWCEQGGTLSVNNSGVTVTFLKAFSDTNYNIQISQTSAGSSSSQFYGTVKVNQKNASNFIIYCGQSEEPYCDWYACGYIA